MPKNIAVVYNAPQSSRYDRTGEIKAVVGVMACAEAVREALLKLRYNVTIVPLSPPVENLKSTLNSLDAEVVFNLFEGFPDQPETEALVPQMLAAAGKPYTGCPAAVLKLALDKFAVKMRLRTAGIATPDFQLLSPAKLHLFRLNFPCIVKPGHEDASHGITPESVVNDMPALRKRVTTVYGDYANQSLVEEFINGQEFNATVIGNARPEVLPPSEIVYTLPPGMPPILTYAAKWEEDSVYYKNTQAVCPARITARERDAIRAAALAAYRLLDCTGYARVDMRRDDNGIINVIEVNPNPDISPGAGVALQAAAAGMSYTRLVERIVKLALDRKKDESKSTSRISFRQNRLITHIKKHAGV